MTTLKPNETAFTFPGQGSQEAGMGLALAEAYPMAKETFTEANDILGYDLSKIAWSGEETELNQTQFTQPALFTHSMASYRVFRELNPAFMPASMAGHSLGQFSALCAGDAFSFEDGLKLVARRGELMAKAGDESPGGMAAILGLEIPHVETICAEASAGAERVELANDNCPGQVVISGNAEALQRAMKKAEEGGARRVVALAVSIAAHSYLMARVQEEFNQALAETEMRTPAIEVIGNVFARPMANVDEIKRELEAQLCSRVRWTESMEYMLAQGMTTFVEIGTGNVLSGLIKRISRDSNRYTLGTPEDFAGIME
jgi:[acyl-carrier-protein] S-malonyltransferase